MIAFWRFSWEDYNSVSESAIIDRILHYIAVMSEGIAAFFYSTKKCVNKFVYILFFVVRRYILNIRSPPCKFEISLFQISWRFFI